MTEELLTALEKRLVTNLGDFWADLCTIVGDGVTREADLAEAIVHVHALQHFVMAQAAARAYPTEYRLLGNSLMEEK